MKRYHISPKTGRPNICSAKTPEACKFSQEAGRTVDHFDTKEEAQAHIEKVLSEQYAETSSQNKAVKRDLNTLIRFLDESHDRTFSSTERIMNNIPDFKEVEMLEKIDYGNELLLEKDGNYYIMSVWGDNNQYFDYEVLGVEPVIKQKEKVLKTEQQYTEKIYDPELTKNLLSFSEKYSQKYRSFVSKTDEDSPYDYAIDFWGLDKEKNKNNKDSLKVYHIEPKYNRSLLQKPLPIEYDVDMYENEEKQNAREFDDGYLIFDESLNKGFVFTFRSGSEDANGSEELYIKNGEIRIDENDPYQRLFLIEGLGETVDKEYWKRA